MSAVTYFEISGPDTERLRSFYETTLGLETAPSGDAAYLMFTADDGAIGGGLFDGSGFGEPGVHYALPYIEVDDLDAAVEQAQAAGATMVVAPREHGPTVAAHLLDPCGSRFALYARLTEPEA